VHRSGCVQVPEQLHGTGKQEPTDQIEKEVAIEKAKEFVDILAKGPLEGAIEEMEFWLGSACPPEIKKAWKLVKETARKKNFLGRSE
jgi:hypothetical protein